MMVRPATSTPHPLSRKREHGNTRSRHSRVGAASASTSSDDVNSSGLTPAKAIQTNEGQSDSRLATLARITALRLELRQLVEHVAHGTAIGLLDVICDEKGCFSRHKAAEEARTWAEQARLSIETGLMQLDRALHPST